LRAKKSAGAERYLTLSYALEGAPPKADAEPPEGAGSARPYAASPWAGRRSPLRCLDTFTTPEKMKNFYLLLSTHRVYFANITIYNNKKVFFCAEELWIYYFFTKISSGKFENFLALPCII